MNRGLVVEDLESSVAWLSRALQGAFPGIEVRTAGTLAEAGRLLGEFTPEIALVDLGLPDGSGVDLIARAGRECANCCCIVTTIYADDAHLFPALRAGAGGYLLKDQPVERVIEQLQAIDRGEPPLSPAIAQRLLRVFAPETAENDDARLTPRERETLVLIAKGYRLPEVSANLGVTRNTAAGLIKSIYRKLKVSSRAEAALEAARMGLIHTDF
ncbi:MAG: response regulator transcription factor [Gammaproteobacteria bacterium]|nr:response regulator transcription factor [Gammaproteobacteria bacterium]